MKRMNAQEAVQLGVSKKGIKFHLWCHRMVRRFYFPRVRPIIEGWDSGTPGPLLLAAGHRSMRDYLCICGGREGRWTGAVLKQELFYLPRRWFPIAQYFFARGGAIPVDREARDRGPLQAVKLVYDRSLDMMVFIEGTRNKTVDNCVPEIKPAVRGFVPSNGYVVFVGVWGTDQWRKTGRSPVVAFGNPIPSADVPRREAAAWFQENLQKLQDLAKARYEKDHGIDAI